MFDLPKFLNMRVILFLLIALLGTFQYSFSQTNRQQSIQLIKQGDYYLQMADLIKAEDAYNRAIEADISYADAYMKRASFLRVMNRFDEAMRDYNVAISINPFSEYIFNERSKLKMIAMDYKGALEDINQAISLNPTNTALSQANTRLTDIFQ